MYNNGWYFAIINLIIENLKLHFRSFFNSSLIRKATSRFILSRFFNFLFFRRAILINWSLIEFVIIIECFFFMFENQPSSLKLIVCIFRLWVNFFVIIVINTDRFYFCYKIASALVRKNFDILNFNFLRKKNNYHVELKKNNNFTLFNT